ncbi:RidA family protein [Rasiella sp. SM2506]|uniref:RidA family protein n=1 Tax=Rasiella sp. SM2506 TaxID=3423914 RepID=UPI003D7B0BDE
MKSLRKHPLKIKLLPIGILLATILAFTGCKEETKPTPNEPVETVVHQETEAEHGKPDYFQLRPEVEEAYGYSHAVKIGNSIKVSGAVSMDDAGNPTAIGDLAQQMKNCYADLEKILAHYGCTFDDVVVENVFTTHMPMFLENAAYRTEIYKNHFPTGSWLGVKELAIPEFMIEIELEVHKAE